MTKSGWNDINLKSLKFKEGSSDIKLSVSSGTIYFDWMDMKAE